MTVHTLYYLHQMVSKRRKVQVYECFSANSSIVCMCSTTTQRVLLLQRPVDVAVHWAERFLELSVIQATAAANAAHAAPALFSLSICCRRAPRSSGQPYRRRYRRAQTYKVAKTRRKQVQWFHEFFHTNSSMFKQLPFPVIA